MITLDSNALALYTYYITRGSNQEPTMILYQYRFSARTTNLSQGFSAVVQHFVHATAINLIQ